MPDTDLLWESYLINKAYDLVLNGGIVQFRGKSLQCGGLSYYLDRVKKNIMHLKSQDRILDLGCGTGNFTLKLLELDKTIFAVDSNPYMLKELIDHSPINNCFISKQDANNINLPVMFDGIISNNVLYLSTIEPEKFFSNAHKYLVSGGLFVLSSFLKDPNLDILIEIGENELKNKYINVNGIDFSEYDILKPQIDTVINVNRRIFESGLIKNTYSLAEISKMAENYGFDIIDAYIDYAHQGFTLSSRRI